MNLLPVPFTFQKYARSEARTDRTSKINHQQTQTEESKSEGRINKWGALGKGEHRRDEKKHNETTAQNHFIIPILAPNQPLGLAFRIRIFFALQLFIISPLPKNMKFTRASICALVATASMGAVAAEDDMHYTGYVIRFNI
jgi:hypothetical protein